MTLYAPLWAQNTTYPAAVDRLLFTATYDGGVFTDTDLKVGPRAAGTNMSVDVAAGRVVIPGPSGNYLCVSDAIENRPVAAAPPVNTSRVDLVVATVTDNQATGVGDPAVPATWDIAVVTGTPAASNPQAPAVPANSVALARLAVTSSTASVTAGIIREARGCADRGARGVLAKVATTADWTVNSTTFVTMPGSTVSATVTGHRWVEVIASGLITGAAVNALSDGQPQVNGVAITAAYIVHNASAAGGLGRESKISQGVVVLDPGVYSFAIQTRREGAYASTWIAGWNLWVFDRGAAPAGTPPFVPAP